jgi:hypothetical protein
VTPAVKSSNKLSSLPFIGDFSLSLSYGRSYTPYNKSPIAIIMGSIIEHAVKRCTFDNSTNIAHVLERTLEREREAQA